MISSMADKQENLEDLGASHPDGEEFFLANAKGNGFLVFRYDGMYIFALPKDLLHGETPTEKMDKLKDTKMEEDDTLICCYSKCGTHWLWEVLEMLRSGVINYRRDIKETRMMELIFKEGIESIPTPRVLNTHLPLRMLPKQVLEKKIKCVQIMRNPKDVCVSFFHHLRNEAPPYGYDGDFAEFTEAFLSGNIIYGSYHQYLLDWKKESSERPELPILNLYYEDMKKDPVKCTKQLAKFTGLEATDKFCEEVAEACSFKKMKKADDELKEKAFNFWKEGSEGTMYRKGETGDWKNWFSVAESERFDQIWNEKMKNSGITFTYSLD